MIVGVRPARSIRYRFFLTQQQRYELPSAQGQRSDEGVKVSPKATDSCQLVRSCPAVRSSLREMRQE